MLKHKMARPDVREPKENIRAIKRFEKFSPKENLHVITCNVNAEAGENL